MAKFYLRLTLLYITLIISACSHDELENRIKVLERDITKMETILGHNEPMNTSISTTQDNKPITLNLAFKLKKISENYIRERFDTGYTLVFSRYADAGQEFFTYAVIHFDPSTKTATPVLFEVSFLKEDGVPYYAYFDETNTETFQATVSDFILETGKVSANITIATSSNSSLNLYQGNTMEIRTDFSGHLNIIKGESE